MTQFLGRQDCIESLRKDLVDLQGAILDVFSRTGPVRFSSWKFPDKLSCNLDMVALLDQYDFVDGEDAFNQHSHIVLLELVIDRLLLLQQSFSVYIEQLKSTYRRQQTKEKGYVSLGLVVRNYWSNLVQLGTHKGPYKDTKKQATTHIFECDETETLSCASSQLTSRSDCSHCSSARSSSRSLKFLSQNHVPLSPTQSTPCFSKVNTHNVGCQTFESALVPCDACYQVQSVLRKTADALVEMFESEGLPSSLQPLSVAMQETMELGHMTAGDVAQWASEELRDMRRLAKHLQDVRGTVQPLRDRLVVAEIDRDRFRSEMKKAQKELKEKMENYQTSTVQLEFSLQKAQRSVKETEQRLQEEQQKLKRDILSLGESNSKLEEKIAAQQDTLHALGHEKEVLQEKVKALQKEEKAFHDLQGRIQQLQSEISEAQLLFDKESAKYHSACRQQESMQAKQKSLLERVDALDEECEELQRQLGEKEERQTELHNQLQQMSEEKEQQQAKLTQQQESFSKLEKEKQTLETRIAELKNNVAELKEHVHACKDRERLLVAFPELSPLSQAQPQSTGNVILDMEQQLQANCLRIQVLEQENTALQSSLVKLKERAQYDASKETSPQQTWNNSVLSETEKKHQNHMMQLQKNLL
ncbi:coiled-coil domain-containing protein 157 isoform X2 [Sphaeramia orbicularis]|nr:coiled-coil domain-containing protein 157 isoform X2 [Sphaeramia orbicularis]